MVAIITGSGAGIGKSSASVLGSGGQLGGAALGQTGENVFVNGATGGLVITDIDEMLVGRGPDAVVSRTYNSLGAWDGDNDDYWRAGVYRRVQGLTGSYGVAGSTVSRTDWDGSEVSYSWNASENAYVATAGAGAYDTLTRSGTTWTWTDGNSRNTERYDENASGRITHLIDASGNSVTYSYTGNLITRITASSGQYTELTYSGTQLTALVTNSGVQTTRTYYEYDGSGRLSKVLVNLAPSDNSKTVGTNYETVYTYDGSSKRVASIAQSDGTLVSFGYTLVGSDYRVTSIVQTAASGVTRTTTLAYNVTTRTTTVTDPAGQVTTLVYDADGNLTSITLPPASSGATAQVVNFAYNANGDLASTSTNGTRAVTYQYDTHGNITLERDAAGNTITRAYSAKNELLSETRYTVADPDGAGAGAPSGAATTSYVYDAQSNLRYKVSDEDRVSEYRYDAYGQATAVIDYAANSYASATFTEAALNSWRDAISDKSTTQRTETGYDARGNISSVTSYAKLLASGAFDTASERSQTIYTYSSHGELLTRQVTGGSGTESFIYDGLSRVTSSTDFNGVSTSIAFNDASGTTVVTLANGLVQTRTYNKAGELVALAESGAGVTTATTSYGYDNLGRLRFVTDPTGQSAYYFYDAVGRKTADIDADGSAVEYRYDRDNNQVSSTAYANKLTAAQLASLKGGDASPIVVGANTSVVQQSDGLYRITKTSGADYDWNADGRGTLAMTGDFVLQIKVNHATNNMIGGVSTAPATSASWNNPQYGFSFAHGQASATYNGGGVPNVASYVVGDTFWMERVGSTYSYYKGATFAAAKAAGALYSIAGLTSAMYVDSSIFVIGSSMDVGLAPPTVSFDDIRPGTDATNDRHEWRLYDKAQRLVETVNATGAVTLYKYDGRSQLLSVTDMATRMSATALAALKTGAIPTNLYANTNVPSFWNVEGSLSANGTINGVEAFTLDGTVYAFNPQFSVAAGDTLSFTITLKAGASTDAMVIMTSSVGNYGANSDSLAEILSGPGTLTQVAGSGFRIAGLSASTPTVYRVTRTFTQNELMHMNVYSVGGTINISNPIMTRSASLPELPAADAVNDRVSRLFYGNDGRLVGTLDAEGYLTETVYDGAGRKVRTIAYSGVTNAAYRASGDFATLKGSITADAAKDIRHWWIYDARGMLRAEVDGEGGLTRYAYDVAGNLSQKIRGEVLNVATLIATPPTLASIGTASGTSFGQTSWTYNLYGQVLSEVRVLMGGTTATTTYSYDAMRRLVSSTHASTTSYVGGSQRYDKQGRLTSDLDGVGNAALAALGSSPTQAQIDAVYEKWGTSYAYDAAGRLVSKTGPKGEGSVGAKTRYYYTADGSLAYEISALGEVTEYRYNAFGERTDLIVYGKRLPNPAALNGGIVDSTLLAALSGFADAAIDTRVQTVFNVDGSVKQVTDTLSNVTGYVYNAFGQLTKITAPLEGSDVIETTRSYDRRGLLKIELVDAEAGGKAIATSYGYDGFGRAISLTNALNKTTTSVYDRDGRLASTTDALGNTTSYAYDGRDNLVAVTDALGKITRYVYDRANRRIAAIDATGAVVATEFYAEDTVRSVTEYANRLDPAGLALEVPSSFTRPATSADDKVSYFAYDRDGQLRFSVDALRHVTEHVYDASGNVIRSVQYDGTIGAPASAGTVTEDWVASQVSALAGAAGNRVTRFVYDAANRLNYTIDPLGQVTWQVHDSKGQPIKQVEFAATYSTSGDPLVGAMDTWRTSNANAANDRTTRAWYDRGGQLVYSADALGYVQQIEYDKAGNVRRENGYALVPALTLSDTTTLADLAADSYLASAPSDRRVTEFKYDTAGRLVETIDPEGFRTVLTLDAMGQVLTATQAYGTADATTTAYYYDDLGRVVKQVVAQGASEASTAWFFYDALGRQTANVDGDNYLTVHLYDAVGNRLTTTGYAGRIATAFTAATSVATLQGYAGAGAGDISTSSAYDAFGRVTATTDGRGSIVSTSYDVLDRAILQTDQMEAGTADDRTTAYGYDNFGNVTKVTDPLGNVSYNYYDKLNRVVRQVDAERFVSDTAYSRGGPVASLKRYAMALGSGVTVNETTMPGAPSGSVAVTSFGYDKRDQLVSTGDAMGGTESYILNAFGERVEYRTKLYQTSADKITYTYDKRGLLLSETLPIQAEVAAGGGVMGAVVNSYSYDARGNQILKVEAATSKTSRTTSYAYDKLDRVTLVTGDTITVVKPDLTTESVTPTETRKYDARGNLIEAVDAGGAKSMFWYDAFDRPVAQSVQVDTVGGNAKGTLTVSTYDKAGDVLTNKLYGDLVTMPANASGTAPAPVDAGNFRLTSYAYDRSNRLTATTVAGLPTGEWNGTNWVSATSDIVTTLEYDKVGNVVRQVDARGNSNWLWYDKLGRQTAKVDAENYLTVWVRDAEGNALAETRYATRITGSFTTASSISALQALAGNSAGDRTTLFTYDLNGRRTEETRLNVAYSSVSAAGAVSHVAATDASAVSRISYTYNGLDQVLTRTEASLADIAVSATARETVSYSYDKTGRLLLETGQSFTDSSGATVTPRTAYTYDGLNNLKTVRIQKGATAVDADDRITTYAYDVGGRLATMTDAAGNVRTYGYDRVGHLVLDRYVRTKADGTTQVTEAQVTRYDLAGRATLQTSARLSGGTWVFTDETANADPYGATHLRYNAYGELTGKGTTAATATAPVYQETFDYDRGGRLWRSNAGDGVLRFYVYDKAGNQTLMLASAGADLSALTLANYTASITSTGGTSTANAVTTLTIHDKRGQGSSPQGGRHAHRRLL